MSPLDSTTSLNAAPRSGIPTTAWYSRTRGRNPWDCGQFHSAQKCQRKEYPCRCPSEKLSNPSDTGGSGQQQAPVTHYYQPFSSTDILNWQKHTLLLSVEPQGMARLVETIFRTHRPTWANIMQLLASPLQYRREL